MNPETVPCIERDGGRMPVIGLGTWKQKGATCRESVCKALEIGYRHVDTAEMYENEEEVGAGIADAGIAREELFLTTKVFRGHLHPAGVCEACDNSLRRLNMDYIDLFLIHWPDESVPLADTLGAMAGLRQEGKVKHIGVSNFPKAWMKRAVDAVDVPIFCNQLEYHCYLGEGPVLRFCREHDIAAVAYCPLARGRVIDDKTLIEIGKKYDKSPAQIALRWLVRQTGVAAIPKGTGGAHLQENLDIFDFELTKEDLSAVADLEDRERLIDPEWGPTWER